MYNIRIISSFISFGLSCDYWDTCVYHFQSCLLTSKLILLWKWYSCCILVWSSYYCYLAVLLLLVTNIFYWSFKSIVPWWHISRKIILFIIRIQHPDSESYHTMIIPASHSRKSSTSWFCHIQFWEYELYIGRVVFLSRRLRCSTQGCQVQQFLKPKFVQLVSPTFITVGPKITYCGYFP